MSQRELNFVTYLSPGLPFGLFETIAKALAHRVGRVAQLDSVICASAPEPGPTDPFAGGVADVGFLCSPALGWLDSIELAAAAPVFDDARCRGKPWFFSELMVRRDSAVRRFEHLRGGTIAFNDHCSQSGFFSVLERIRASGEAPRRFANLVAAGSHVRALEQVVSGRADAAAVDSNVLAWLRRTADPRCLGLRRLETWGPFPIQPIVFRTGLEAGLKRRLNTALLQLGNDADAQRELACYGVTGLAPVDRSSYVAGTASGVRQRRPRRRRSFRQVAP